jgi:ferredoxin-thioredoxin reductase catalytic chain
MVTRFDVERRYLALKRDAEKNGYHLNPDEDFSKDLVHGLMVNEERYGFASCPCRLCVGPREVNLDIICPCDYRDSDLAEYGTCYCALYVSEEVFKGKCPVEVIPDKRGPVPPECLAVEEKARAPATATLPYPVFRCRVCGYLCAREEPPEKCPICGAEKDRFEKFIG